MPQEVKVIVGEHHKGFKADSTSSFMQGSAMREELQVAGSDTRAPV